MHPHVMAWWSRRERRHMARHAEMGCGPSGFHHPDFGHPDFRHPDFHRASHGGDGGTFGVRRPLRFLAHKLDLDEKQSAIVARILVELKTERAQAAVDDRRTVSAFATAIEGAAFDDSAAADAAERRVESARKLRDAVVKALREIHAVLDAEQRETFAYLVRTGVLGI